MKILLTSDLSDLHFVGLILKTCVLFTLCACFCVPHCELTRSVLGVVHLPVVGADALVHPRVRGRAAVAQRARAAAHRGVRGVEVLRTLEALVIIPTGVQPAVAVLALRVRDPQVPGEVSEQQAAQEAHHPDPDPSAPGHRSEVDAQQSDHLSRPPPLNALRVSSRSKSRTDLKFF